MFRNTMLYHYVIHFLWYNILYHWIKYFGMHCYLIINRSVIYSLQQNNSTQHRIDLERAISPLFIIAGVGEYPSLRDRGLEAERVLKVSVLGSDTEVHTYLLIWTWYHFRIYHIISISWQYKAVLSDFVSIKGNTWEIVPILISIWSRIQCAAQVAINYDLVYEDGTIVSTGAQRAADDETVIDVLCERKGLHFFSY